MKKITALMLSSAMMLSPVSYTHLDVYKRQKSSPLAKIVGGIYNRKKASPLGEAVREAD